jgi:hypothetical protein
MLLENWLNIEKRYGDAASVQEVTQRLPKRVKKRRKLKVVHQQPQPEIGGLQTN